MRQYLENCNDIVSIIVPVYKVEKYIKRCLDSISCQTYPNIEIIVVDDGSSDNSLRICEDCAAKDERIKVFHQENHGVSSARNVGLAHMAHDGYVAFIDADDYVSPRYIEHLLYTLKSTNSQIGEVASTEKELVHPDTEIFDEKIKVLKNYQFHVNYATYTVWGMLISKELISDDVRFDESLSYYEDELFKFQVISRDGRNRYALSSKKLYFHEHENVDSLCSRPHAFPKISFYLFDRMEDITKKYPKQIYILAYHLLSMQRYFAKQKDFGSLEFRETKFKAKKYMNKVLLSMAPLKTKLRYLLAYYFNLFF